MDDPALDSQSHLIALRGLKRINILSRTAFRISNAIENFVSKHALRSIRVLDVGCGSGDIAISIAQQLARRLPNLKCEMVGWDMSPFAVELASKDAKRCNALGNVHFALRNILGPMQSNDSQSFEIAYCSLFLHHFSDQQAIGIMKQMSQLVRYALLVDDLLRTRTGLILANIGCQLLSRSPVVHFDGPQSVRAAFTAKEIAAIAARAELTPVSIQTHWPERFLLTWERSSE